MRKITLIIGMCILLLLATGAGYRFYLSQYEEECYQYKIYYWNETYCMGLGDFDGIEYPAYNNGSYPCCDNSSRFMWCLGIPFHKTLWRFTDECAKYHLVRKV